MEVNRLTEQGLEPRARAHVAKCNRTPRRKLSAGRSFSRKEEEEEEDQQGDGRYPEEEDHQGPGAGENHWVRMTSFLRV